VTASNNDDALEEVIFVISVNVKSLDENEYISFSGIKRSNSSNSTKDDDKSNKEYKDENVRIVNNNLNTSEAIALLEYDCCSDRVSLEESKTFEEKESFIDYDRSHNDSSNNEHVFEDIT
jgi:hypothetical protein